ncbi:MAG: NlpC/P60 family protein [Armatimonadota bacterium]
MIKRLAVVGLLSASFTLCVLGSVLAKNHSIRQGDTLWTIASKYKVSVKDLAQANGLTDKSILPLGKKLSVPSSSSRNVASDKPSTPLPSKAIALGVVAKTAPFRSEPEASAKRLGVAVAGAKVKILQMKWHWFQVKTDSGKIGWVGDYLVRSKPLVAPATASKPTNARYAANKPNGNVSLRYGKNKRISTSRKWKSGYTAKAHSRNVVVASSDPGDSSTNPSSDSGAVHAALAMRGSRYRFGGTSSRGGFDCSGFTRWVYSKQGVSLPHSAAAQSGRGARISKDSLKPGDLVFFQTRGRRIGHVGVYTGKGKFVHASNPRGGVKVDSLSSGYYGRRFTGARRVK